MTQHRSTVELQSAPALGPLFARAILSRQTRRAGTTLQDSRLSLVAQPIGADKSSRSGRNQHLATVS